MPTDNDDTFHGHWKMCWAAAKLNLPTHSVTRLLQPSRSKEISNWAGLDSVCNASKKLCIFGGYLPLHPQSLSARYMYFINKFGEISRDLQVCGALGSDKDELVRLKSKVKFMTWPKYAHNPSKPFLGPFRHHSTAVDDVWIELFVLRMVLQFQATQGHQSRSCLDQIWSKDPSSVSSF